MKKFLIQILALALAAAAAAQISPPPVLITNILVQGYGEEYSDFIQQKFEIFAHEHPGGKIELRIGDGTPGGQLVSGSGTRINLEETMYANGQKIQLNQIYNVQAQGGELIISSGGEGVLRASTASAEGIIPFSYEHTAGEIFVRITRSTNADPARLEYTTNLVSGAWEDTGIVPVPIDEQRMMFEWPIQDRMFFFRVRGGETAKILIAPVPFSAPNGIILGGIHRTNWPAPPSEEWVFYYSTNHMFPDNLYYISTNHSADVVHYVLADPDDTAFTAVFPSGWKPSSPKKITVEWSSGGPPSYFRVGTNDMFDQSAYGPLEVNYIPQFERWIFRTSGPLFPQLDDSRDSRFYNPLTDTFHWSPYE